MRWLLIVVVLVAGASCAGCSSGRSSPPPGSSHSTALMVAGHPFVAASPWLLHACQATAAMVGYAVPCPMLIPEGLVAGPEPPPGIAGGCRLAAIGPQNRHAAACLTNPKDCPRCRLWRGWVVGSSIVPSITVTHYSASTSIIEQDTEHLVIQASPYPVRGYARAIGGVGWYPGARVEPQRWVQLHGWRVRIVAVPASNDSAFRGHLVMVWTTNGHTYAVGFHQLLGRRTTLLLDTALVGHIRLVH